MSVSSFPDARSLAFCRMALGIAVAMNSLEVAAVMLRIEQGRLPVPTVVEIPVTEAAVWSWTLASVVAAGLIVSGTATAAAAIGAALLGAFALLWDQQNYSNHLWLAILLTAYLAFARADSRWSVRSALLGPRDDPPVGPALLMVTQMSICYLFAGLSKLNPWWLAGDTLTPALRFDLPAWLVTPLATVVILTELFVAIAMWFRHTRWLALATGVMLHLGIVALMTQPLTLVAFSVACLAVYPLIWQAPYLGDLVRRAPSPSAEPVSIA